MEELKLQDAVAAKYKMQGNHNVGEYHWAGHIVHLQHTGLELADRLVREGFPYLEPKEESPKVRKTESPKAAAEPLSPPAIAVEEEIAEEVQSAHPADAEGSAMKPEVKA